MAGLIAYNFTHSHRDLLHPHQLLLTQPTSTSTTGHPITASQIQHLPARDAAARVPSMPSVAQAPKVSTVQYVEIATELACHTTLPSAQPVLDSENLTLLDDLDLRNSMEEIAAPVTVLGTFLVLQPPAMVFHQSILLTVLLLTVLLLTGLRRVLERPLLWATVLLLSELLQVLEPPLQWATVLLLTELRLMIVLSAAVKVLLMPLENLERRESMDRSVEIATEWVERLE